MQPRICYTLIQYGNLWHMGNVTELLARWEQGDKEALGALTPIVYNELRNIARGYLRQEREDHTLAPTALVHEAWLRLARQEPGTFANRKQFFGLAAQLMRHILIDHARSWKTAKRGGSQPTVQIGEATGLAPETADRFLLLNEALDNLARVSPRQAQVIEYRYFGGLNLDEIAELTGVSAATICRDQQTAEAWLSQMMQR